MDDSSDWLMSVEEVYILVPFPKIQIQPIDFANMRQVNQV